MTARYLLIASSDNDKLLALMPQATAGCLKECQIAANKADGCAENDFACHCVNYNAYSNVCPSLPFRLSDWCLVFPHPYLPPPLTANLLAFNIVIYNQTNTLQAIEPCAFALPQGPKKDTCTVDVVLAARPIIQDLCNFFNATLYADYRRCPQKLSKRKTFGIIAEEEAQCSW
jgi:hypothetical protein